MSALDYSAQSHLGLRLHTADTWRNRRITGTYDAAIVGTGPGGLTAAATLAEAGLRVIMFEAGRFWPRGSFKRKQSWAFRNLYQDRGTRVMLGNAQIPVASGRGVGGGTLVNSGISFRAPDWVLDLFVERYGLDYWEQREALFAEVEQTIGVANTSPAVAGKNSMIARRGFSRLGVRHDFMPRNAPACAGCGTCQTGCPTGGKASADVNWLPRALRAGAVVFADSRIEQITMRQNRAVGVVGAMRDPADGELVARIEIRADKILLACGAIDTAQILLRNGLANSSGMVGRNLHVQPGTGVVAQFDDDVEVWSGATQGYYAHHPEDPEILAETFSAPMEAFYTQVGDIGESPGRFIERFRKTAACGFVIRDHSAGAVHPVDEGPPNILYDVVAHDRRLFTRGMEFVSEMFFRAGSRRVRPLIAGASYFTSFNECRQFIRSVTNPADFMLYSSHPMGTCRIGEDPTSCVVRPQDGRTHDHEGLYVVDSSLFPTALAANPQVSIMAQSLALARRMART